MIDVDALRRDYRVSDVAIKLGLRLIKNGPEFKALCPFHADKNPSLTINDAKGIFKCFACQAGGDVIDLVEKAKKIEFAEACKFIANSHAHSSASRSEIAARKEAAVAEAEAALVFLDALETDIPEPFKNIKTWNVKQTKYSTFHPTLVHVYRTDTGAILGCVMRCDTSPGYKITPTIRYGMAPDGEPMWLLASFDRPRPLYGLEMLGDERPVLVVEGEKCRDAAAALGLYDVVAWPGGTGGVNYVDWSPLSGRDLILWGDADEPGERAMIGYTDSEDGEIHDGVAALAIKVGARSVRYVPWQTDKDKGWDVADMVAEGATAADVKKWIEARIKRFGDEKAAEQESESPAPAGSQPDGDDAGPGDSRDSGIQGRSGTGDQDRSGTDDDDLEDRPHAGANGRRHKNGANGFQKIDFPFRVLGHDHGVYFYLPTGTQQVVELQPGGHTIPNLLSLAASDFWEGQFPAKGAKTDFKLSSAINGMMRGAENAGIFTSERLRGRGAWLDAGRTVIHVGNAVVADGKETPPAEFKSTYIYEAGDPLEIDMAEPATVKESRKLLDIINKLNWERGISGTLLTGWCMVSMVCGALNFRPAVWVAGPSGSGKTTAMDQIVMRLLGKLALRRDGSTTEAHLRQALWRDARPVVIDEAETEDKTAAQRMQSVLQLARVSSTGGVIGKGGKDGTAMEYTIRAAFCFSSINVNVAHYADESRISKLVLARNDGGAEDEGRFAELNKEIAEILTPEYSARMFARAVQKLPELLENIKIYTDAAASTMKNRRAAQQIGTLLAGAHMCRADSQISLAKAIQWIKERDWADFTALESPTDERRLITRLALNRRRITTERGTKDLTIGELIEIDQFGTMQDGVGPDDARRELGRVGIKVKSMHESGAQVIVASKSPEIARILADSPWASDWSRSLRSIPGAVPCGTEYFSPSYYSRGVMVPYAALAEEIAK